jgi:hypothetical protein
MALQEPPKRPEPSENMDALIAKLKLWANKLFKETISWQVDWTLAEKKIAEISSNELFPVYLVTANFQTRTFFVTHRAAVSEGGTTHIRYEVDSSGRIKSQLAIGG